MKTMANEKHNGATAARIHKIEAKVKGKQRQIRENLRKNRDLYWTEVAEKLETAYESKDMKLYYKLIPTKGRQSLTGQNMRDRQGNGRTYTKEGLEARWLEHFNELFNQPGEMGDGI
jgi:hypothetical protein